MAKLRDMFRQLTLSHAAREAEKLPGERFDQ
jgi:hypothetical protein